MKTITVITLFGLFLILGLVNELNAQTELNFKRIINNWPTIQLYYKVFCDGKQAAFDDKKYFKVYENGKEQRDFTLWCPDFFSPCPASVTLVFDASKQIDNYFRDMMKSKGNAFVDMMDGVHDQASIIWFASSTSVAQTMTNQKSELKKCIDSLPSVPGVALYDGVFRGLIELINNGVNRCRAVIVFTYGIDSTSTDTPADIITTANKNKIRIFPIAFGPNIHNSSLQAISNLTGGRYYENPNTNQILSIYQEIVSIIISESECIITYQASNPDGTLRTVDLTLVDFCDSTATRSKTYRAPLDTTTAIGSTIQAVAPSLSQNYPNPFFGSTEIHYSLPKRSPVNLSIFDVYGRKVVTLVDEMKEVGTHHITFDTHALEGGLYFYRLHSGAFSETKKMLLVR